MGYPTSNTSKKQDNRKPNFQPNAMPAAVAVEIVFQGVILATLGITQGPKLSENGNVTYSGGISASAGWTLPGDNSNPMESLGALSFNVAAATTDGTGAIAITGETVPAKVTGKGVHMSEKGNMTACHMATVAMPRSDGEPVAYVATIWPTLVDEKGISLSVRTFPKPTPRASEPIRGLLVGELTFK